MTVGLTFHEHHEIDVAVGSDRSSGSGAHQQHTDEVAAAASPGMPQREADDFFVCRFIRRFRRFEWFRHGHEF